MRKFYSRILLAFALVLSAFFTKAQVANYQFTAASGTYTEVSGGTAVPIVGDGIISASLPIGFTFNFEGTDYTQFRASSDGFLTFNTAATNTLTNNLSTGAATRRPLVAPLWDDLNATTGTSFAFYQTTGAVGSRVFTMEWRNWRWNWQATGVTISFQVKLYEGTNVVEFIYRQESGAVNSASASMGLSGAGSGSGSFLSLNNTSTSPTTSSTVETTTIATKPATGQIYRFAPPLTTDISVNDISTTAVCPSNSSTISVTLKNSGINALNFTTSPVIINATLSGSSTGTATATISSGTLASGATTVVTLTPTFTVGAGAYTITAIATMTGDLGVANNTLSKSFNPLSSPLGLTITPSSALSCSGAAPVMLTASGGASTQVKTSNSGAISLAIPDGSIATGVNHTLNISGIQSGAVIDSMIVTVNATHTWLSDLRINLKGPNGQIINLMNARGGSGDNLVNTRITSSTSAPSFATGIAPLTGTFTADLAALTTVPATTSTTFSSIWGEPNGDYTLYVYDAVSTDVGSLTGWSITIYYQGVAYVWTPSTGLYTDAAGTTPYTGGSSAVVYAKPSSTETYSITATSAFSCTATASTTITAAQTPTITAQPTSVSACTGNTVTFTVGATGTGLTYQWRKDGVNILGASSSSYSIAAAAPGDVGNYDVVITGTCAPVLTSNTVVLALNAAPIINTQPTSQSICPGSPVTFSVAASGTGLTYQWRKGGVNIPGATSSSYTIASVAAADAGNYDVVVTTSCGGTSTTSSVASLTLNALPAITTQPVSVTNACFGNSATFTVTATGTGLTYQWFKDGVAIPGATGASYTVSPVSAASLGSYTVRVSGTCAPAVTSNAVTLATPAVNTWIGTVSTAWNTAANWCGGVPTSTTDVVIPKRTPFSPLVSATSEARTITVNDSATVTINNTGTLNLYGNIVLQGTGAFSSSTGTIAFRGATNQSVPTLNLAHVIMNGAGGATLGGNMTISNSLTLTLGNITLGSNNLQLPQVNNIITNTTGSVASHIITNGTGVVKSNSITSFSVIYPVGFDAASYNPVTINNGDGKDYNVRVTNGINPGILDPTRAVNRTWIITPSATPSTPATILFQYADAHANGTAVPTAAMEVGVFANNKWIITTPDGGNLPAGTSGARTVSTTTNLFGAFVVSNAGGIDVVGGDDITNIMLMPNEVRHNSMLRVVTRRATRVDWTISDGSGRVVRRFTTQLSPGQNDIPMNVSTLANGNYMLSGYSEGFNTQLIRFIKL